MAPQAWRGIVFNIMPGAACWGVVHQGGGHEYVSKEPAHRRHRAGLIVIIGGIYSNVHSGPLRGRC